MLVFSSSLAFLGQTLPEDLARSELPGAKYDQGDDEDDDQFRKADAEHQAHFLSE
jgi:hypothetical protein